MVAVTPRSLRNKTFCDKCKFSMDAVEIVYTDGDKAFCTLECLLQHRKREFHIAQVTGQQEFKLR